MRIFRRNIFRQYLFNLLARQSGMYNVIDSHELAEYRGKVAQGVIMQPEDYQRWAAQRRKSLDRIRAQLDH